MFKLCMFTFISVFMDFLKVCTKDIFKEIFLENIFFFAESKLTLKRKEQKGPDIGTKAGDEREPSLLLSFLNETTYTQTSVIVSFKCTFFNL